MHWCYFDESWREADDEFVGVLGGCIGPFSAFAKLEKKMFRVRSKYYGRDHAKDPTRELKGNRLLGNNSFKNHESSFAKNLCIVREILEWAKTSEIRFIGVTVYGDSKPQLLSPDPKNLTVPFKKLCDVAEKSLPNGKKAHLVFDQRLGAQQGIAIGIKSYLAGKGNSPLHYEPLFGVSHTMAGLQLADIVSYTIARHAVGKNDVLPYYRLVSANQAIVGEKKIGLTRLQKTPAGDFKSRRSRKKK